MTESTDTQQLQITRTFAAPPQRVFDAWVDPAQRMGWWCAQPGMSCDVCEIEPRVGGRYRINMRSAERDKEYVTVGEFLEFDPPGRLVFSWSWEKPDGPVRGTTVTAEFRAVDAGTELTLTHEGFADAATRDDHLGGWTGCLDSLAQVFGEPIDA